ncbi:uncharacterized protein LOC111314161 isoform X3 [Durio zibethinus]|uniref:Uncharacterized protein LOC111314161 isoform X3 n=1 Tax=Durio zibethinus TaxID=66656 RepID=A0A6P6B209_DURZI|nr:uncharacterized protein LOC111314161 isoform X3 [Durio zibethinus]
MVPPGVSSPQVAANHVISARNRPNFVRLLNFAQDVNYAIEASRKSRIAFGVANSSLGGAENGEVISSVKKALDFNFQDCYAWYVWQWKPLAIKKTNLVGEDDFILGGNFILMVYLWV